MAKRFLLSDNWANDLDKNASTNGDIVDVDVIDQSIELIITTIYGERLFNITFGCGLTRRIFENMTPSFAEDVLNEVAAAIKRWEDRIVLYEKEMRIIRNTDENSIILLIPYAIKRTGITSIFKKKLVNF